MEYYTAAKKIEAALNQIVSFHNKVESTQPFVWNIICPYNIRSSVCVCTGVGIDYLWKDEEMVKTCHQRGKLGLWEMKTRRVRHVLLSTSWIMCLGTFYLVKTM